MKNNRNISKIIKFGWRGIEIWSVLISIGVPALLRAIFRKVLDGWSWYDQLFLIGGAFLGILGILSITFGKQSEVKGQKAQLSDLKIELTNTKTILANTQTKLSSTETELSNANVLQVNTQKQLSNIQGQLMAAESRLACPAPMIVSRNANFRGTGLLGLGPKEMVVVVIVINNGGPGQVIVTATASGSQGNQIKEVSIYFAQRQQQEITLTIPNLNGNETFDVSVHS